MPISILSGERREYRPPSAPDVCIYWRRVGRHRRLVIRNECIRKEVIVRKLLTPGMPATESPQERESFDYPEFARRCLLEGIIGWDGITHPPGHPQAGEPVPFDAALLTALPEDLFEALVMLTTEQAIPTTGAETIPSPAPVSSTPSGPESPTPSGSGESSPGSIAGAA